MDNPSLNFQFLIAGHDTVEVCYYLRGSDACIIDFHDLWLQKEILRQSKTRQPKILHLGTESFVLKPGGSGNGFPFIMENDTYIVEFGEFNSPSFRVKFRSMPLWRFGALALHQRFMAWSESAGFYALKPESLSRVDFTFDYLLPVIDFDEQNVVSLSEMDDKYRIGGKLSGLKFGQSDIVLRIYDKVLEIERKSKKTWMYDLWGGVKKDVWRIEWQARQQPMRRFGIRTFDDLFDLQGDLVRYLMTEHDTLRIKTDDSNRSRWPLHPLWQDLFVRGQEFQSQGVHRVIYPKEALDERLIRLIISVYGYTKQIGAILALQQETDFVGFKETSKELADLLGTVHDPITWKRDVEARIAKITYGQA